MDLSIGEHFVVNFFGFNVHLDTLITLWCAMGIILVFSGMAVSNLNIVPNKMQSIFEKIVSIFDGLTKDMGKNQGSSGLVLMCIFLLIIVSNLLGQLPFKLIHLPHGELASPTNDLNMTGALAVFVLLYYIFKGIKAKGLKYFKHYFQPVWFMTPFNILEDFTRPFTLALRLFANILAGEVVIAVFLGLIPIFINQDSIQGLFYILPEKWSFVYELSSDSFQIFLNNAIYVIGRFLGSLLALLPMAFELFVAFIQALVFMLLASTYLKSAAGESH